MTHRWPLAMLSLLPLTACSLLSSFDGYVGSSQPGGGLDSATEGSLAVEGGPLDGATLVDGSTGDDAAGLRFCDTMPTALFCADFDDPMAKPSPFGWNKVSFSPDDTSATVTLNEALPRSSPRSLLLDIGAGLADTSTGRGAVLLFATNQTTLPSTVSVHLSMLLDTIDQSAPFVALLMSFGADYVLELSVGTAGISLVEIVRGDAGVPMLTTHPLGGVPSAGVWRDATVAVDLSARSLHVTAAGMSWVVPLVANATPATPVNVALGAIYFSGTTVSRTLVKFDDVAITVR